MLFRGVYTVLYRLKNTKIMPAYGCFIFILPSLQVYNLWNYQTHKSQIFETDALTGNTPNSSFTSFYSENHSARVHGVVVRYTEHVQHYVLTVYQMKSTKVLTLSA